MELVICLYPGNVSSTIGETIVYFHKHADFFKNVSINFLVISQDGNQPLQDQIYNLQSEIPKIYQLTDTSASLLTQQTRGHEFALKFLKADFIFDVNLQNDSIEDDCHQVFTGFTSLIGELYSRAG